MIQERAIFWRVTLFAMVTLWTAGLRADEAQVQSAFLNVKGVRIHYIRAGAGEPVVLIHGLYASAKQDWQAEGTFALLAKDHDVIALDLPGHGDSDKPNDPAAYGPQMVDDVRLLMDHLRIKKAHLVGYSLGGIVALKFISLHPDRVRSSTLGGMGWMKAGGSSARAWQYMGLFSYRGTPKICVQSVAQLGLTEDQLRAVAVPMEIIIGEKDPVRKFYVKPLLTVRRDWPVFVVPGVGHVGCLKSAAFKNELVRWIDANK